MASQSPSKESDNHSLEQLKEQVKGARKEKAALEARLAETSKSISETMSQLPSTPNTRDEMLKKLMAVDDVEVLKSELQPLHLKLKKQAAHIKDLEGQLEVERGRINILRHDNHELKKLAVDMTALAEQEEEQISNKLLKRISDLKTEKSELLVQVEQEEEYMTNMLQKKLNQLQKEKIDMENALEQEQEYIVNKLQKQLDSLRGQPVSTASSPCVLMHDFGRSPVVRPVSPAPGLSPALSAKMRSGEISSAQVEGLLAEVTSLKNKTCEMEKAYLQKMRQCNDYKSELIKLRKQNNMSVDDIPPDDGIPDVFRSVPPSPSRQLRARSTSTSFSFIPLLQLDGTSTNSAVSP